MNGERRNQIFLMIFLGVVLAFATVMTFLRPAQKSADPGFADYSLHAELDAPAQLEVDAAREAESINSGEFKPFIVGESREH